MGKECYGIYENLSDAYRAMLHLIGSGFPCHKIIVITPKLSCLTESDRQRCRQETHQKYLLARTKCLRMYGPEYVAALNSEDRAAIDPYLGELEAGHSIIMIIK